MLLSGSRYFPGEGERAFVSEFYSIQIQHLARTYQGHLQQVCTAAMDHVLLSAVLQQAGLVPAKRAALPVQCRLHLIPPLGIPHFQTVHTSQE